MTERAPRKTIGSLVGAAVLTAVVVVAVGWSTGLREIAHTALIGLAVVALLPFTLIALGLFIGVAAVLVGCAAALLAGGDVVTGGGGAEIAEGGARLIPIYYGWLARRRHPVFWGVPAGVLLGGLVLWGLITLVVLPGEARTTRILTEAKTTLEERYESEGRFPPPSDDGQLVADDSPVLDGFERPILYNLEGRWKAFSFTLRSLGFDGRRSSDDLCISGATRLADVAQRVASAATVLSDLGRGEEGDTPQPLSTRLAAIRTLTCD